MPGPAAWLPERMNAAALLLDANLEAGRGEKVAVVNAADGSSATYAHVLAVTNRAGNALRALGVTRGERVLILLPDSLELVACFLGAIKIGAVPVPTNTLLEPAGYEHVLNDSRAAALVTTEALASKIEAVRGGLLFLRETLVVGRPGTGQRSFGECVAGCSPELSPELLGRDDVCFWLYSSGTTGAPKGVVHRQRDMLVAADLYARPILGLEERDRTFSVAKLFFAYGLGNGLYFPFRAGATTILNPAKSDPRTAYQIIQTHRLTVLFSVPTGYAGMLAIEGAEKLFDTSSLRLAVSAGEALPAALFEAWKARFGVEILDGIGSTEIAHIFISSRRGRVKPGSTGEIVPGYEARLVDEEGRDVPRGAIGDLWIKGDSICAGYWNQEEKTRDAMRGDWIRTGDKYVQDEEGYYWHQGRSDDMLKVGGMWVSPVEVENALAKHPDVLESAVAGAPDEAGLVKPKAWVVLKGGRAGSPELLRELQAFVKERIAAYKYPRWIEFVPELPKTATGKTQRYKLRAP